MTLSAVGDEGDLALACGTTIEKAGVSERTAYRRLADPAFKRRLDRIRGDMVQWAMGMHLRPRGGWFEHSVSHAGEATSRQEGGVRRR